MEDNYYYNMANFLIDYVIDLEGNVDTVIKKLIMAGFSYTEIRKFIIISEVEYKTLVKDVYYNESF